MQMAPVALFVYNRLWHTQKTLQALSECVLANQTPVIIFLDGAKENATQEQKQKVEQVRAFIRETRDARRETRVIS